MTFIQELAEKSLDNEYFKELIEKTEKRQAHLFFKTDNPEPKLNNKELVDILRFADLFSRSENAEMLNIAYKITSLLIDDFKDDPTYKFFTNSILIKLGNFPALSFIESGDQNQNISYSPETLFERAVKETFQQIPNSDFIFTDAQYKIFELLKNNNHFSFSGPTSLGKSFIINAFIRHLITEHKGTDNLIILVPTRALINQTILRLKKDFKDVQNYKILAHPIVPAFYKNESTRYIFVFTPERLLSYLADLNNPKIDYLFIDEAQKIIAEKDTRSPIYYYSILQAERKSIKLFFASPNIPNPEVFLQLFEKSTDEKINISNSPVAQNKYFLDLVDQKCSLISGKGEEISIPLSFDGTNFFYWLKKLSSDNKSIIYCNTKEDTINYALDFSNTLPDKESPEIDEVINLIKDYLHEKYFLIDCLKKGVAFHFGSLPQRIREKVEILFTNKVIDYVFCTSTLLEGVNLPAKNIFILSNAIGLSKFTDIDFWNLAGRAGRLTKELSGNIICTRIERKGNRWDNPDKDLKVVKSKAIRPVNPVVISGQKNFFKNLNSAISGKKFTKKSPTNTEIALWNQYANIAFIHELRSDDSVLRSNFIAKIDSAKKLLADEKKKNIVPERILSSSPTIKARYQNDIYKRTDLEEHILTHDISYQNVLAALKKISRFYNWEAEESGGKSPMYKSERSLDYYATIMNNWITSTPLNLMITNAIKHYQNQGFYYDNNNQRTLFSSSNPHHINFAINELITKIDNILRFKFKNYFENYYLLLKDKIGEENAGANWAEFLEYGTTDYKVIEIQNIGIPRHLAIYILKHHSNCLKFENKSLVEFNHNKLLSDIKDGTDEKKELVEIFEFESF